MSTSVQSGVAAAEARDRIAEIEQQDRVLVVSWGDGHRSLFHYIWLRDNCFCEECGSVSSSQDRVLNLLNVPPGIRPLSVGVDEGGHVAIAWAPDRHKTVFEARWLRAHCYSKAERARRRHKPTLWAKELGNQLPEFSYSQASATDSSRLEALLLIRDYGFTIMRGTPQTPDGIEKLAKLVGYEVRDTYYGRIFHIETDPASDLLSSTSETILAHNDEGWRAVPLGIVLFHCLEASADGGGQNYLIDGFRVAEALRQEDAEAFDVLSRNPRQFSRSIAGEVEMRAEGNIICVDQDSNVVGLRWPFRFREPLDLPEPLVEPMYDATRKLLRLIYSGEFNVQFRLEPGDAVVFDNHRLLHGRTGFSGRRHVQFGYVDRDDFHMQLRLLARRLGRDHDADLLMSRGALS
jgi:gamma-butyrobetaine dioxygenase